MLHKPFLILCLAAGLAWPLSSVAQAPVGRQRADGLSMLPLVLVQDDGSDGADPSAGDAAPADTADMTADVPDDAIDITDEETATVTDALSSGRRFCGAADPSFKADCLSDQFATAAKSLPAKGGYAAARKALLDASAQLHALATSNADAAKPAAKVSSGKSHSHRALTPVANPGAVNAKAAAIVSATKVVLLRSAEGSKERSAAYKAMAAGV